MDSLRQRWPAFFEQAGHRRVERLARMAERRQTAERVADVLVDRFGASRVVLFGSLARQEPEGKLDIDLAVEGLAPQRELEAWARRERCRGVSRRPRPHRGGSSTPPRGDPRRRGDAPCPMTLQRLLDC